MSRLQDCCISALLISSRIFLRTCGFGLMIVYFCIVGCIGYSFLNNIMPEYKNPIITTFSTLIIFSFGFGSVFNYLSAAFTSPGYTRDYQDGLLRGEGGMLRDCRTCNIPKPPNAHHCSFCNECVINLDHHCPWINNCVGFNNMRYFLLFLLNSFLACAMYVGFAASIFFEPNFQLQGVDIEFFFAMVLSFTVSIALFFFNVWAWYMAFTDQQFINILKARNRNNNIDRELHENSGKTWTRALMRRRLLELFGTESLILALLPSRRKLKINPISCELEREGLMGKEIEISTR